MPDTEKVKKAPMKDMIRCTRREPHPMNNKKRKGRRSRRGEKIRNNNAR